MLHIAQPENVLPWFDAAAKAGVNGYDLIGISYYKKWSKWDLAQLKATVAEAKRRYGKEVVVVETGYPFTLKGADSANNLLDYSVRNLLAAFRSRRRRRWRLGRAGSERRVTVARPTGAPLALVGTRAKFVG